MAAATTEKMTKRKRRSIPNPVNKWVQHPKITSPAARARAYLVDAGLYESKSASSSPGTKKKVTHKDILDPKLDLHSPEVKFGKMIGGTTELQRHKAIQMLKSYFQARCDIGNVDGGISELDLMKLWKGMWHTLYMADKVPVQDALSKQLAKLMWALGGTEEEDEYAAQVYLDAEEQDDDGEQEGEEEDDDGMVEGEDYVMEEVENTLEDAKKTNKVEKEKDDDDDKSDTTESSDNENVDEMEEEEEEEDNDEDDEYQYAIQKHCRGAHLVSLYVRTFFRTVKREWGNMDKHRVDKFYTAIRFMIHEVYKYMSTRHWNIGIIRLFNDALFEEVLAHTPNGLRLHLIDITLSELATVNSEAPLSLTEATFLDCLEPYFALVQSVDDKIVHKRVVENVLLRFLEEYSFVCDAALQQEEKKKNGEEEEGEEKSTIFDQVHVGSVAQFIFGIASDPETSDRYRKQLYELHKMFSRKIKAAGRDVEMDSGGSEEGDEEERNELDGSELCEAVDVDNKGEEKGEKETDNDDVTPAEKVESTVVEDAEEVKYNGKKASSDKKEKKKKRKNKKKEDDTEAKAEGEDEADKKDDVKQEEDTETSSKKKKKKKKKKAKKEDEDGNEVITISKKEQTKVAKAGAAENDSCSTPKSKQKEEQKKQRSPPSVDPKSMLDSDAVMSDIETDGLGPPPNLSNKKKKAAAAEEKDRRVSFGKVNHSKSYKASMKAIKTVEKPYAPCKTPEKSILLNKRKPSNNDENGKKSKKIKSIKNSPRKSATDYF